MQFNYNVMRFSCDKCGKQQYALDRFAVVSDFRVLFEWNCECGEKISTLISMDNLVKNMPPAPDPPSLQTSLTDLAFMRQAHITLEEKQ